MFKNTAASSAISPRRNRAGFGRGMWVVFLFLILTAGCTDTGPVAEPPYLLRVGDEVVTVLEYEKAVELAKAAYPHSAFQKPEASRAIQLRVLREMTETLCWRIKK